MYLFTVLTCRSSEGIVTMAILESIQNSYVLYQTSTKLAAPSLNICTSLEICIELTTRYYDHSKLQNLKGVGWGGGVGWVQVTTNVQIVHMYLKHLCLSFDTFVSHFIWFPWLCFHPTRQYTPGPRLLCLTFSWPSWPRYLSSCVILAIQSTLVGRWLHFLCKACWNLCWLATIF